VTVKPHTIDEYLAPLSSEKRAVLEGLRRAVKSAALDAKEFDGVAATGKQVSWPGVDLFRMSGGKIVEARFLSDSLGLFRQLGAAPPPPAAKK
jgi:ketosteroid isomerase-like protein